MSMLIITTGGTIGALPYRDFGDTPRDRDFLSSFPEGKNPVFEALTKLPFDGRRVELEPRDSKQIDQAYLDKLTSEIASAKEDKILITLGTDRMLDAAEFLYKELPPGKTIIITGAMIPLLNGPASDGFANLAFALEKLKNSQAGLFIVLCDFMDKGEWKPHLYPFKPGLYEKLHDDDARFSRLRKK